MTFVGFFIGTIALGALSDKIGRRRVAVGNVLVYMINAIVECA